jgi:hypothetical protein
MNCFEARAGFAALWRKKLEPGARAALMEHLKQCRRCDRAFRVFTLSGIALYSDSPPPHDARHHARGSALAARTTTENGRRALPVLSAMAAMIFAAGLAAYLSVSVPRQTFDDALGSLEATGEVVGQDELPAALSDFAG